MLILKIIGKKYLKNKIKTLILLPKVTYYYVPTRVFYRDFYIKVNGKSKLRKSMYF